MEELSRKRRAADPIYAPIAVTLWEASGSERRCCTVQVAPAEVNRLSLPEMPAVLD